MPADSNLLLVRQKLVYKYLPHLALGLGIYYCLIAVAHSYLVAPHAAAIMVVLAASGAAALLGMWIWLKRFPPPESWAHPIETAMGEIVLLNCLGHLYFLVDLRQTTNVALAIVGGGLLFLSAKWLAVFIATCLAGWALVVATTFREEDWTHFAFMLLTATMIATLTHFVRVTGIRQLEGTRMMIQEMELRKRAEEETNRLEAELRQAEKLRSLGVLAGGIAHDFNNLLVGVLGNAELARAEIGSESRIQPYLAEISAAARCAADLTRQMLDYAGKSHFLSEPVDLANVVKEMAGFLRASIPKNVRLELQFPENLPAIEADATQVRQIIMNLAINAAEAVGKQQGTVVLSAGVERLDGAPPATEHWYGGRSKVEYVFLSVIDPGPGLDPERRARIFEPFFSTKFAGRGLGLAAVLGIMRGHRGGIRVESNPGVGTIFTVWFVSSGQTPLRRGEPAVEKKPIHGTGTVLVVDDEPAVRKLMQRVLERRGFSVLAVEDGVKALDVFSAQRERIVLVVLDLTMPGLSGQETLERLLVMQPGLPMILTSGYAQEDISKRLTLRQTSFLQKPFTPADLLSVVAGALQQRGSSAAGSH